MSTTGYTIEQYKALEQSIASGEKRVKYNDKEVEYRSISEMKELLAMMRKALGLDCSSTSSKKGLFGGRRVNAIHSKGLD